MCSCRPCHTNPVTTTCTYVNMPVIATGGLMSGASHSERSWLRAAGSVLSNSKKMRTLYMPEGVRDYSTASLAQVAMQWREHPGKLWQRIWTRISWPDLRRSSCLFAGVASQDVSICPPNSTIYQEKGRWDDFDISVSVHTSDRPNEGTKGPVECFSIPARRMSLNWHFQQQSHLYGVWYSATDMSLESNHETLHMLNTIPLGGYLSGKGKHRLQTMQQPTSVFALLLTPSNKGLSE